MPLYRITRDVHVGEVVTAGLFEPLGVTPPPRAGDRMDCWCCGEPFARLTLLYGMPFVDFPVPA